MKRKVIQLAGKTSVVSLPSAWIKKNGIKKGEELDVIEYGNDLLIKNSSTPIKECITLDVSDLNSRAFACAMSALHKFGYDEITLLHNKPLHFKELSEHISNLFLGFVVIDQSSTKTVLKSIANDSQSEFDSSLRRAFLVTLSLADSSYEALNNKNFEGIEHLVNLENTNNQLTSFCLRLINKRMYKETKKTHFIYIIIWTLEKVADEYKHICNEMSVYKKELNQEILNTYKLTNDFLKIYYDLFYKFNIELMNSSLEQSKQISILLGNLTPKNNNEMKIINHLNSVNYKLYDLSSSIFALNHDNIKELKKPVYSIN